MQPTVGAGDLTVLLALARAGTLAGAATLLGVDSSTVFRSVQRLEKTLGQRLFDRSRSGYRATELGLKLAVHAERIEAELQAVQSVWHGERGEVSGTVRISTTDTLVHGLVLPVLPALMASHPLLHVELLASNERVDLTQRDADIALRATHRPPLHLIGRGLGPIRVVLYARKQARRGRGPPLDPASAPWVAPDVALPDHPSVRWRRRRYPKVVPRLLVDSIQSVLEAVAAGIGIGVVPVFLAQGRSDLVALGDPIEEAQTQLWLLTHPESRHLRRIAVVAQHLATTIHLD